jgi:hypothetical protein
MFFIYKVTDHGTDGRDTRVIGYFADLSCAESAAKGRGAMGHGDGSVDEVSVFEEGDFERTERDKALAKLTPRERALLGL